MKKEEKETISFYNNNALEYFNSTRNVNLEHLYKEFLCYVKPQGKILDIGCGSGRDSLYFKKNGYKVTAFDGSLELVKLASKLLNQEVLHMRFEDITLKEKYDGVWACASLLHVKRENLVEVLKNISGKLNKEAGFYISFKYGNDEYVDHKGRYFNCYKEEIFKEIIEEVKDLKIEKLFKTTDLLPGRESLNWINIICVKS